jgi:hypothetical protein
MLTFGQTERRQLNVERDTSKDDSRETGFRFTHYPLFCLDLHDFTEVQLNVLFPGQIPNNVPVSLVNESLLGTMNKWKYDLLWSIDFPNT